MPKRDEQDEVKPLSPDDPYWMHSAIYRVRARHRQAGTSPATFGDTIREAGEDMLKDKDRLGIRKST
jgi:hypothetical protein